MKRLLSFLLLLLLGPFSQANASLLPANEAFQLNAQIVEDKVELTWSISSGYFVVKESIEVSTAEPNQLGGAIFPQAIPTVDAFLGNITIYPRSSIGSRVQPADDSLFKRSLPAFGS